MQLAIDNATSRQVRPWKWQEARKEVEKEPESERPFRLWNPGGKGTPGAFLRWRYFTHLTNAHWAAMKELRWAEIGTTIEIIDIRDSKQWGSYTRRVDDIGFLGGDNIPTKFA